MGNSGKYSQALIICYKVNESEIKEDPNAKGVYWPIHDYDGDIKDLPEKFRSEERISSLSSQNIMGIYVLSRSVM